jgi:anti-sigma B factor antagonist
MIFAAAPSGHPRTLRLEGELDMATVPQLLTAAEPLLAADGDLTLELEDLTFVDSTGMRAFFRLASRLRNGRLVLVEPANSVRRVLELTGLDENPRILIEEGEGSGA